MRQLRVYVDTSVLGAVFDEEFSESTIIFFKQVRDGRFEIVVSSLLADEIRDAPQEVRDFYLEIVELAESVTPSGQTIQLQQAYLDAGIVTQKWAADALHIAMAAVAGCDMVVSWNFRHMVHYDKRRKYNAVNTLHGYNGVDIITPAEVIRYEEDV
jgi:predicted nucleic acid-binding protein